MSVRPMLLCSCTTCALHVHCMCTQCTCRHAMLLYMCTALAWQVRSMLLCAPAARLATTARNAREHDYEEDEGRRAATPCRRGCNPMP